MSNDKVYKKYLFQDSESGLYLIYNAKKKTYDLDDEVERALKVVNRFTADAVRESVMRKYNEMEEYKDKALDLRIHPVTITYHVKDGWR